MAGPAFRPVRGELRLIGLKLKRKGYRKVEVIVKCDLGSSTLVQSRSTA